MKEKYKAIIQKIENSSEGARILEKLTKYTYATNVIEAQRNIVYHLQNDDKIYLGIDKNHSTTDKVIVWEISTIDLERNLEEIKTGRGKDKKPRHRRTKEEMNNIEITLTMDKKIFEKLKIYTSLRNVEEKDVVNDAITTYIDNEIEILNDTMKMLRDE